MRWKLDMSLGNEKGQITKQGGACVTRFRPCLTSRVGDIRCCRHRVRPTLRTPDIAYARHRVRLTSQLQNLRVV